MSDSVRRVRITCGHIALVGSLLIGAIGYADPIEIGFSGPFYPPGTGANSRPTGEKPESKLWWNDNSWWGILWSTGGGAYHIHKLDLASQEWLDTGTVVDDRFGSRADVRWDGQRLYVVSHVFTDVGAPAPSGQRGELYRFSYDRLSRRYQLNLGFPIEVTGGTSETLVMDKDSVGQLWVTWVENGKVMVNHSVNGNDRTWARPFVLPVPGADEVGPDDISTIIAYNGFIGVMWSDQQKPTSILPDPTGIVGARMLFGVHKDGAHPSLWAADAIYTPSGDDHINMKALKRKRDGSLFAVIKTDKDAKLIILLACKSSLSGCRLKSDWTHHEVFRDSENDPTRPILLIDEENDELYVFAVLEDDDHRSVHYKKTPVSRISFADGLGVPFIRSATDFEINDPTSTKQNVNSITGLVVLASDEISNRYFHNFLALP